MEAFAYAAPTTLPEALALLGSQWGEADVLAGGTDLLTLLKDYLHTPKRVVNLKGVKELGGIQKTGEGLRIGALVTLDELLSSPAVAAYPCVAAAIKGVGSPQLRNMATVGGDLCQRPRCWYFRLGYGVLAKDQQGRNLARDGDNRYHAVFGNQTACFVSGAGLGPPLVALSARVKLVSPKGTRELPVEKFFVTPAGDSDREIALAPNEILTEILIPAGATRNATYEVRQKGMLDWPLASASVALTMKGTAVDTARVVLGQVAPTPWRAAAAEKALAGRGLTTANIEKAAQAAVEGATPLAHNGYKVQLARTAVKRALAEIARQKG
ncbi:MAG: molybdopterin dehydrogenase [Acidobacteria bacterium]|nr:molybdopterin dehydrogenase [Acidobacteriota bacterium]